MCVSLLDSPYQCQEFLTDNIRACESCSWRKTERGLSWDENLAGQRPRKRSWVSSAFGIVCPPQHITGGRPRLRCSTPAIHPPPLHPLTGQQRLHSQSLAVRETGSACDWLEWHNEVRRQKHVSSLFVTASHFYHILFLMLSCNFHIAFILQSSFFRDILLSPISGWKGT